MKKPGQIVILRFPQTNFAQGKPRPARRVPNEYDDWLVCMISSNINQYIAGIDSLIENSSQDYNESGLTSSSVIRTTRVAVVSENVLQGTIGEIPQTRLTEITNNIVT